MGDVCVVLEPKVLAVLHCLLKSQDQMVSYDELITTVWPDTCVESNALQRCITRLRKILGDDEKTIIETFPKLGYRLNSGLLATDKSAHRWSIVLLCSVCLLIVIAFASSTQFSDNKGHGLKVKSITPLTFSRTPQKSPSAYDNLLFYIEQKEDLEQLVILNRNTQEIRTLYSTPQFYGGTAINPDGKYLLFSEVIFKNNVKCSQLLGYHFDENKSTVLIPCENRFIHSPQWLNNEQFIFLKTAKDGSNSLHFKNLFNNAEFLFDLNADAQIDSVHDFNVVGNHVLISGKNAKGTNGIWRGKVDHTHFIAEHFYPTNYAQQDASKPTMLNDETVLQIRGDELFSFHVNGSVLHSPLLQQANINLVRPLKDGTILAEKSFSPWRISQRIWQTDDSFIDTQIAPSSFSDYSAQYQPNGSKIAYLSNRSGDAQIWVNEGETHRQITHTQAVTSFLWDFSGKGLWYLKNEQLNYVELGGDGKNFLQSIQFNQLFQTVDENTLLARVSQPEQLVRISPMLGKLERLSTGSIGWAQQLSGGMLVYASKTNGKLFYREASTDTDYDLFPDMTIQWRFFYRDGKIVTQDKTARIWAIDLVSKSRTQLAKFDENALFATDMQLNPLKMLSDNFGDKLSDIILINLEVAKVNSE